MCTVCSESLQGTVGSQESITSAGGQGRFRSVQTDLSLRWATCTLVGNTVSWHKGQML